ncbi:hypothetical protein CEXT_538421 [Caerostris extrusa]|uniref:Uncharacterized protein n=1 Tax=Caerostris extrusa TaxID=172846 RepID=A0AAV4SDC1_CAEEX|nr:hypothetical protein CEXT_538421 [Caerostris extrusa]
MVGGSDRETRNKTFSSLVAYPSWNMNTLWKCPEYEKLPTPDQPLLKRCAAIHLDDDDDSRCSKRMAYNLARYLEKRAKEDETREYSIVDFKNADAAVDALSFVKNNVKFNVIL